MLTVTSEKISCMHKSGGLMDYRFTVGAQTIAIYSHVTHKFEQEKLHSF